MSTDIIIEDGRMTKDTRSVRLVLPLPPSVNSYWTGRGRGGQRMRSKRAKAYLGSIMGAVYTQGSPSFGAYPLVVTMYLHHSPQGGDIDNYSKGVFDGLTHCRVWDDDSQIIRVLIQIRGRVPKGCVVIDIRPASHQEIEVSQSVMNEVHKKERFCQNIGGIPYNPAAKKTDHYCNYATDRVDISKWNEGK